jgi:hypothetical protein
VIRQAHTYLVGAVGGATLIAIAIVVFVLLVSAQVFRDWPIAALGDGGDDAPAVSESRAVDDAAAATAATPGPASPPVPPAGGDGADGGGAASGLGGGASGGEGGGGAPAGSGGGSEDGGDGADTVAVPQGPASGGGSASDGGAVGAGGAGAGNAASSPSAQVTKAVEDAVTKVDETATGGALDDSGVTDATEGVVEGAVGPESAVGQTADGAADAVGGLLPGQR